jgi:hypothetical protein
LSQFVSEGLTPHPGNEAPDQFQGAVRAIPTASNAKEVNG